MKKRTRLFFVAVKKLTLITILIGLILVAYFSYLLMSPSSALRQKFFGKTAEYQGIIRLWNVETFEGGSASRAGFLNWAASKFEKQNKGAFLMVQNMSLDEMKANLEGGIVPDMFFFGTGIAGLLSEKMQPLPSDLEKTLLPQFVAAGLSGGRLLACPYAFGMYGILSSNERLEKAGAAGELKDVMFDLAYNIESKKTSRHVFSLTFGKNEFVDGQKIFSREFDKSLAALVDGGVVDPKYDSQSPYEAYMSFAAGKSSALLGTQRDVFRMENRLAAGKESDILLCPLGKFTDLVNFASITSGNKKIISVCEDFLRFLLGNDVQKALGGIGLLSPTKEKIYESGNMAIFEDAVSENMIVEGAF